MSCLFNILPKLTCLPFFNFLFLCCFDLLDVIVLSGTAPASRLHPVSSPTSRTSKLKRKIMKIYIQPRVIEVAFTFRFLWITSAWKMIFFMFSSKSFKRRHSIYVLLIWICIVVREAFKNYLQFWGEGGVWRGHFSYVFCNSPKCI